jgi:hypothetical protein
MSECGDTVEGLAQQLRLNATEYPLWLHDDQDKRGMPDSATRPLAKRLFSVPNKAFVDVGVLGPANVASLGAMYMATIIQEHIYTSAGFRVIRQTQVRGDKIVDDMHDPDLYVFAYYGHGDKSHKGDLLPNPAFQSGQGQYWVTADKYASYHIAELRLIGCYTHSAAAKWRANVSKDGELRTIDGLLNMWVPWVWNVMIQKGE